MKVEIEINDLNTLMSALSIGIKFISDEAFATFVGCEQNTITQALFEKYKEKDSDRQYDLLKDRFNELVSLYRQLEEVEKNGAR